MEDINEENTMYIFKTKDQLLHIRTQNVYVILKEPDDNHKLTESSESYYTYRRLGGGTIWRQQISRMEDGRFKLL